MSVVELRKLLEDHAVVPLWPQAANALGLSRGQIYRAAADGSIRTIKVGHRIRVPTSWIRQVVELDGA